MNKQTLTIIILLTIAAMVFSAVRYRTKDAGNELRDGNIPASERLKELGID